MNFQKIFNRTIANLLVSLLVIISVHSSLNAQIQGGVCSEINTYSEFTKCCDPSLNGLNERVCQAYAQSTLSCNTITNKNYGTCCAGVTRSLNQNSCINYEKKIQNLPTSSDPNIYQDPTSSNYTPTKQDVAPGGLVPCTNDCDFDDVFRLINNLIEFAIKVLLIPLFVFMIMYAGYKYITAMGNPSKVANLKSMFANMVMGLVLVLCAFLIVKGILYSLGYTEGLLFFD